MSDFGRRLGELDLSYRICVGVCDIERLFIFAECEAFRTGSVQGGFCKLDVYRLDHLLGGRVDHGSHAGNAFRTLTDAVKVLQVIAGEDPADAATSSVRARPIPNYRGALVPGGLKGARIGVLHQAYERDPDGVDADVKTVFAAAVEALKSASADLRGQWFPKIAAGEAVIGLALEEGKKHNPAATALKAERSGNGFKLTGAKTYVIEGYGAGLLVVSARTSGAPGDKDGVSLFLVPGDAQGLVKTRLALADSRGAANIKFDGVEVGAEALLGEEGKGWDVLEKTLDRARAAGADTPDEQAAIARAETRLKVALAEQHKAHGADTSGGHRAGG